MPSFDCGGGRCGEFSCSSCCDDETIREYWSLFQTGIAKSDREARSIMTSRINDREALARSAPTLRADLARVTADLDTARSEVARLTAEVEAMRRCLADVCHVVLTDDAVTDTLWIDNTTTVADRIAQVLKIDTVAPFGGPSEALDALRARKVGG